MKKIIIYENIKKILLVVLGIILSLVVLEIGLQITSFTLSTIKKYRNKITKYWKNQIPPKSGLFLDQLFPPIAESLYDKKLSIAKFIYNRITAGKSPYVNNFQQVLRLLARCCFDKDNKAVDYVRECLHFMLSGRWCKEPED